VIYILILIPLFVGACTSIFSRRKYAGFAFIVMLSLAIIASIRPGTGTDYQEYSNIWYAISASLNTSQLDLHYAGIEFGYKYFIYFLSAVGDIDTFFVLNAVITIGLVYIGLYRLRDILKFNLLLAVFIFFCCFYIPYVFNAMRQGIAMGMFVFALKDFFNKKTFRVLTISVLASMLHSTGSLIFISYLIFIAELRLTLFCYITIIISTILYLSNALVKLVNIIAPGKFEHFMVSWGGVDIVSLLLRLIIIFCLLFFRYSSLQKSKALDNLLIIYITGFCLYLIFYDAAMLAARFNMFFRVLEIVIYPCLLVFLRKREKILFFLFVISVCSAQLYIAASNPDNYWEGFF
jgi:hypothetical protein